MQTQITHLKLARYPEALEGAVRPIHWDVDPSSACDHRCRGCPYIYEGELDPMLGVARPEMAIERRQLLGFDAFATFVGEAVEHGAKAITFVGGGEPTLHPGFEAMMRATTAAGLKFGVVTHLGRKYKPTFFETLATATWVRVSVNAGTQQTYLRHQGKDDFLQVLANIRHASKRGVRLGISFLITNDNYGEIALATQIAKDFGAAYIQFKPIIEVDLGKAYESLESEITEYLAFARDKQSATFQVLDQWSNRLDELKCHAQGAFSGPCHVPRFNPKLGANGVVYTCCELAYSVEGAIGNIYEEPLAAILEKAAVKLMEMSKCPHCWDKPINAIINDGKLREVSPPPESIDQEFV